LSLKFLLILEYPESCFQHHVQLNEMYLKSSRLMVLLPTKQLLYLHFLLHVLKISYISYNTFFWMFQVRLARIYVLIHNPCHYHILYISMNFLYNYQLYHSYYQKLLQNIFKDEIKILKDLNKELLLLY